MKQLLIFLFLVTATGIIFLAACATKPTDQECIYALRGRQASPVEKVFNAVAVNRYTVKVEDHIFYKACYSSFDGRELGIGIFGTVIKMGS